MEKLELKHIAPYLPYELNGYLNKQKDDCFIIGATEDFIYTDAFFDELYYTEIKPILRPLSDLLKNDIKEVGEWISIDGFDISTITYNYIQSLLEYHFDIFGLIEKGLAIDLNTL